MTENKEFISLLNEGKNGTIIYQVGLWLHENQGTEVSQGTSIFLLVIEDGIKLRTFT